MVLSIRRLGILFVADPLSSRLPVSGLHSDVNPASPAFPALREDTEKLEKLTVRRRRFRLHVRRERVRKIQDALTEVGFLSDRRRLQNALWTPL